MSPLAANLITAGLVGLALVGLIMARRWPAKCPARLGCVSAVFLVLGLFAILSRFSMIIWDGGFARAEFQIMFEDANRRPVEGVELRMEDLQGHTFYHYPVTDYLPTYVPTSNSNGLMVFHHVGDGVEFGGRYWLLFGFIPVGESSGPVYVCRFLHRGGEVHRIRYSEMDSWRRGTWDEAEKVKRRWKRPEWPASQLLRMQVENEGAYDALILKLFDLDRDGKLNPEEGAACRAGTHWRNEKAAIARLKGEDPEEEMEFPVVRRTLTIRTKPE